MKKALLTMLILCVLVSVAYSGGRSAPGTGSKVLTLWTWKIAMVPGFAAAGELFEKKTGFRVEVEAYAPDDTHRQKVLAAANSGDLPDLIHWWATRGMNFENVLVEFTDKVDDAYKSHFATNAFNNSYVRESDVRNWGNDPERSDVVKALKVGQLFQIPVDVGGAMTMFANNNILKQVGLENKVPDSYEQFIEYAATVARGTNKAGVIFAGGLADVYYNWWGRAVEACYLGPPVSVDLWNNRAKMSDPKNILPLKMYESLCRSGAVLNGIAAMNIDQGDAAFAAGEAAYLLGGTYSYGNVAAMGMDMKDVFSFVVPVMRNGAWKDPYVINANALTALSIPKTSQNFDAAWEYIKFIAYEPEGVPPFVNGAYLIPAARLDAATSAKLDPAIGVMYSSLSDKPSATYMVDNDPNNIGRRLPHQELYKDMQLILTGNLTAEQAAARFDSNMAAQWAAGRQ